MGSPRCNRVGAWINPLARFPGLRSAHAPRLYTLTVRCVRRSWRAELDGPLAYLPLMRPGACVRQIGPRRHPVSARVENRATSITVGGDADVGVQCGPAQDARDAGVSPVTMRMRPSPAAVLWAVTSAMSPLESMNKTPAMSRAIDPDHA
jgi:hypothetical protein